MNKVATIILLTILPTLGYGISRDTIRLQKTDILEYKDTVFFGLKDSVIILPEGVDYKIVRNRLVLAKDFNTENKAGEAANYAYKQYLMLLKSQMVTNNKSWEFNHADSSFTNYKGSIIRNIRYVAVDVFEGSVHDTTRKAQTDFGIALNKSRVKSRQWVIERNIKFKKYDKVVPRIISDNERLLRGIPYIEDARIILEPTNANLDSVDVVIITKDNFQFGITFEPESIDKFEIEPYNVNFLGTGHKIGAVYTYAHGETPSSGYGANYNINNVLGTFTSYYLGILRTYDTELIRSSLNKPFLTTNTRLGGESSIENRYTTNNNITINTIDSSYVRTDTIRYLNIDSWAGISLFPFQDLNKTFINIAGRYNKKTYSLAPIAPTDSNYLYNDYEDYFASITLKKEKYIKTSKLLGFGATEDVGIGRNLQFVGGFNNNYFYKRYYLGCRMESAFLTKGAGLFSIKLAGGGYLNNYNPEDVLVGSRFIYFSPLIDLGSLKVRNILYASYTGLLSPRYTQDLSFGNKIRTLNQIGVYGNSYAVIRYQPIVFTPLYWVGFQFAFTPFADIGWISPSNSFEGKKSQYSVYGVNLSIKNESFTIPALTLQFGYLPKNEVSNAGYIINFTMRDLKLYDLFSSFKPSPITSKDFN